MCAKYASGFATISVFCVGAWAEAIAVGRQEGLRQVAKRSRPPVKQGQGGRRGDAERSRCILCIGGPCVAALLRCAANESLGLVLAGAVPALFVVYARETLR